MDRDIAGLKLRETDEYERLVMFFAENGLEFNFVNLDLILQIYMEKFLKHIKFLFIVVKI